MVLAEDDDFGRRSWSCQSSMFLSEQYDSAGKQRTNVQGPPRDRLGAIFGQVRKLISRHSWMNLGWIWLPEAGFYTNLGATTKCRLVYIYIYIYIYMYIWPWLVCIRHSKLLREGYHAKIMVLLEEDHDLCRGSWSWQRMMILAEDDDPGRGWWSWQTIMILAEQHVPVRTAWFWWETRNHHSGTTSGPPRDQFRPTSKLNFPAFAD